MGMMYTDVIGEAITSLSQSLDSATILVSSLAAPLRLLDKTSGKVLQSYAGHENKSYRLRSCLGLRDTIAISGSENGSIFAWDLVEGGEPIEKIEEPHKGKVISAVAWNGRAKGGEKDKALWASAGGDGKFIQFFYFLHSIAWLLLISYPSFYLSYPFLPMQSYFPFTTPSNYTKCNPLRYPPNIRRKPRRSKR